jgi:hypothetical protein
MVNGAYVSVTTLGTQVRHNYSECVFSRTAPNKVPSLDTLPNVANNAVLELTRRLFLAA